MKNRSNIAASILQNPELLEDVYNTAKDSAGSALEENEKYLDSISGKIEQLKNEGQRFATEFLDSGFVKNVTDILVGITKLGTDGVSSLGAFRTAAMAAFGIFGAKNIDAASVKNTFMSDKAQGGLLHAIKNQFVGNHKRDLESFNAFKTSYLAEASGLSDYEKQAKALELVKTKMGGASSAAQRLARDVALGKTTMGEAAVAIESMGIKAKIASFGMKLLSGAVSAFGAFIISSAIQWFIGKLIDLANAEEKTHDAAVSMGESIKSFNAEVKKNSARYSELLKTYEELSSGVNSLGQNVGLTEEQFNTYQETIKEMVDMNDDIKHHWDAQNNLVVDFTSNLKEANEEYERKLQNDAIDKLNGKGEDEKSAKDVYDDINNLDDSTTDVNYTKLEQYRDLLTYTDEELEKMVEFNQTADSLTLGIASSPEIRAEVKKNAAALDDLHSKYTNWLDDLSEDVTGQTIRSGIDSEIKAIESDINSRQKYFQEILQAQAYETDEYWNLDEDQQNVIDKMISNMDNETRKKLGITSREQGNIWLEGIINGIIDGGPEVTKAFTDLFALDISDMPVDQAYNAIKGFIKQIMAALNMDDSFYSLMLKMLGFGDFASGTVQKYDRAVALGSNGTYGQIHGGKGRNLGTPEEIKAAMDELSINTDKELDDWIGILETVKSLNAAIEEYKNGKDNEEGAAAISFEEAWNNIEADDDAKKDSLENAKAQLIELAKAGKLTRKELEENDFGAYLIDKTKKSAEALAIEANKMANEIARMGALQGHYDKLFEARNEKKESKTNRVSDATLAQLYDDYDVGSWSPKNLEIWKKYEEIASSTTSTVKDLKKAENDLATAYFRSNKYLQKLNKNTSKREKKKLANQLDEAGVKNADEVVEQQAVYNSYREAKGVIDDAAQSKEFFKTATEDSISALADEALKTGTTKEVIMGYVTSLITANKFSLDTSGSIQNLSDLITKLDYGKEAVSDFIAKMNSVASYKAGKGFKVGKTNVYIPDSNAAKGMANMLTNAGINTDDAPQRPEIITNPKGGHSNNNNNRNSGSPNKTSQKNQKQHIDWIERRITRINNIIGNIQAKIENIGKWTLKIGKNGKVAEVLAKLSNAGDNKRVSKQNKQLDKEIKYYKTLYRMQNEARKKYASKAGQSGGGSGFDNLGKTKKGGKGKWTGVAAKIKKKVGKGAAKKIIDRISSGKYTKKDLKYWFATYGQGTYDLIQQYIDYYDKAKSANQGKKEAAQAAREAKIQKQENKQNLYDSRVSRAEAKEATAKGYAKQNKFVQIQLDNLKKSYAAQMEIAKLNGEYAEYEKLEYEYKKKQRELLLHEIENIVNDYERIRAVNNRRIQNADNMIAISEAYGARTNLGWYESKNKNERNNLATYSKEREAILDQIKEWKDKDMEGTSEYNDAIDKLQNINNNEATSLQNLATNVQAIRTAMDSIYDEMRENNNYFSDKASFLSELLRDDSINNWNKESGYYMFTGAGLTRMAANRLTVASKNDNINRDVEQLNDVRNEKARLAALGLVTPEEIDKYYKDAILKGEENVKYTSFKDLSDAEKKFQKQYMDDVNARKQAEDEIISLMKEYYEAQKTYLSEMIDAKKKMLNEEKELYDYEKNIAEKTKNIATIQKQLAAIRGDNSEEGKARRQKLQSELDAAQKDLQDTEYDRWKTDQESMLDNMMNQYNDIIDRHMHDTDALLSEGNKLVGEKSKEINTTLDGLGTTLGSELTSGFNDVKTAITTSAEGLSNIFKNINSWLEKEKLKQDEKVENADSTVENSYDADTNKFIKDNSNAKLLGTPGLSYTPTNRRAMTNAERFANLQSVVDDIKGQISNVTNSKTLSKSEKKKRLKTLNSDLASAKQNIEDFKHEIRKTASSATGKEGWLVSWLVKNATSTTNAPKSDLNKVLLGYYGRPIKKEQLSDMAAAFGFADDGDMSSAGAAYRYFKHHKYLGFKTGGIGKLVKASGEDGIAMVRNGEGFIAPEHVSAIQNLLKFTPDVSEIMKANAQGTSNNTTIGALNFELPNVTDPRSFIEAFQNSKEMQRLLKVSVEDLTKNGRFTNNIFGI